MKLIPVILILSTLIFFACHKHKDPGLEGQYQAASSVSVGPVVLYAANYSTTDEQFIRAYLNRTNLPSWYFNFSSTESNPYLFTINIHSGNLVTINDSSATINAEITSETDSTLILSEIDSTTGWWPTTIPWCFQLYEKTTLVQPQKVCEPTFGGFNCKYRRLYVVRKTNGQLLLPMLTYQSRVATGCYYAVKDLRNIFKSSVLGELHAGDTVVVQQKTARLNKQ